MLKELTPVIEKPALELMMCSGRDRMRTMASRQSTEGLARPLWGRETAEYLSCGALTSITNWPYESLEIEPPTAPTARPDYASLSMSGLNAHRGIILPTGSQNPFHCQAYWPAQPIRATRAVQIVVVLVWPTQIAGSEAHYHVTAAIHSDLLRSLQLQLTN